MLSKRAKYGLQALITLGRSADTGPRRIAEIAADAAIPKKFLELILLDLRNAGIVTSKKGRGGGYALAHPANLISLGTVVRLLDGPLAPISCVSQTAYRACPECPDETTCGVRMVMKEVRDAIAAILDGTTVQDVVDRVARANLHEEAMQPAAQLPDWLL